MRKSIITLSTVAVVGLGSAFFSTTAHANTVEELEERQSEIQDERAELRESLSDAEAEIADVLIELEELNDEIERVSEALERNRQAMDETEEDIAKTEEEVDALEAEIEELEKAIEKRHDILKDRMVSYQKSGGDINYLEVIFGAQSFSDFINRVSAVNKIADSDTKLIEQQEEDKSQVKDKQDQVLDKLDELKAMKQDLEDILGAIEAQQEENEEKKQELKDKENELTALVEELEMEDSSLASLEREVRENIEAARQPAPAPAETAVASEESSQSEGGSSSESGDSGDSSGNITQTSTETNNPSPSGGSAIEAAYSQMGTPYVWAGKDPSGFDCSGFVSWAFAQSGKSIPSFTGALANTGTRVSTGDMQPGDLVFFRGGSHVGIYVGNGQFIGSQSSTGVDVASMTSGYWGERFDGHVRRVN
ncbi:C40 family peptidase [Virgibacillus kimchii]